jgi:hypothetical protein
VRFEDILESHEKQKEDESSLKFPDSVTNEFLDELPDNPSSQYSKSEAGKTRFTLPVIWIPSEIWGIFAVLVC